MKQLLIPFLVACFLAPGSVWFSSASLVPQISGVQTPRRQVPGGLPLVADLAQKRARVPSFQHIGPITVVLASRDPKGLQELIAAQQDPASPEYHQWLTPQEFGDRFGRLPQEYAQLGEWLRSTGLTVSHQWPNRLQLTVGGPAEAVERAFNVQLDEYQLKDEVGFAANRLPAVPAAFPFIKGISGLHSFTRFQPMVSETRLTPDVAQTGNTFSQRGPSNLMAPADIATVYNLKPLLDQGLDGSGVTIAVAARCDFNVSDPVAFRSQFNLPPKDPIKVFPFGPRPNRGGVEEVEAVLDVEWAGATAPDATVKSIIAPDIDFSIQAITNNLPEAKVISVSFGGCERFNGLEVAEFIEMLFAQAATQGQSILVSSGDNGVADCLRIDGTTAPSVNVLASPPQATGVGGTNVDPQFDPNGNATRNGGETGWTGSGGGDSIFFPKPAFQTGVGVPDTTVRTVPDVALLAGSPAYAYIIRGALAGVGGTSVSTPCWAGLCAILNEAKQTNGLGNINPEIYRLGNAQATGAGAQVFFDTLTGNNSFGAVQGFTCQAGYDRVTGWGSYNAALFVENFRAQPVTDTVAPTISLQSPVGGEEILLTDTSEIRWTSTDNVGVVSHDILLSLDSGATFNETIVTGLPATTLSFQWTPADYLEPTTQARIAVRAIDAGFNFGTASSPADFSLIAGVDTEPPSVRVIYPNGDEKLKSKSSTTITWLSSDKSDIRGHEIFLSTDGGQTFPTKLGNASGTANSFVFEIPASLKTKKGMIRVVATDMVGNVGQDESNGVFTIKKKK